MLLKLEKLGNKLVTGLTRCVY